MFSNFSCTILNVSRINFDFSNFGVCKSYQKDKNYNVRRTLMNINYLTYKNFTKPSSYHLRGETLKFLARYQIFKMFNKIIV